MQATLATETAASDLQARQTCTALLLLLGAVCVAGCGPLLSAMMAHVVLSQLATNLQLRTRDTSPNDVPSKDTPPPATTELESAPCQTNNEAAAAPECELCEKNNEATTEPCPTPSDYHREAPPSNCSCAAP